MKQLYEILNNLKPGKEYELFTVLSGACAGQKLLLEDGQTLWFSGCSQEKIEALPGEAVFCEKLGHACRLVICGGGYVGQAVTKMAALLGWHVTVIDDREAYAREAAAAGAKETYSGSYAEILSRLPSDGNIFYVTVTREHCFDLECLREILKKPFGYVGVMGSHTRAKKLRESLQEEGFGKELAEGIHAPIGLSIGAQTPEEIAVSIVAQIIQVQKEMPPVSLLPDELMQAILKAFDPEEKQDAVLATITAQKGSTPRMAGTRMLIRADGSTVGTIGGGIMEAEVIKSVRKLLAEDPAFRPFVHTIDLSGRSGKYADMLCGGITDVFLEPLVTKTVLK